MEFDSFRSVAAVAETPSMEGVDLAFHETPRLLQSDFNSTAHLTATEIIRTTCKLYGSIFAILFVIFLFVRRRYPTVYNIKKSFPALNTPVADDAFGAISWIWRVFQVDYEDICEQCGMDAVTTIRLFEFGVKLSLVGVLNSFFLMPIYKYKGDVVLDDPIKEYSLSNLAQGHFASIATTVAAYILFGAAMHFIDKDFEWFTEHRHVFLSKKRAQNYSIFLSGLPPEMQSDGAIKEYFRHCFSHDTVVDGDVALVIPNLENKVAERNALIPKFEHAISVLTVKGETPMHKTKICGGEKVESIPAYKEELDRLNKEISEEIDRIETVYKGVDDEEVGEVEARDGKRGDTSSLTRSEDDDAGAIDEKEAATEGPPDNEEGLEGSPEAASEAAPDNEEAHQRQESGVTDILTETIFSGASVLKTAILGGEEGSPRDAAFVSFSDLTSANLARQAIHHHEPWFCVPAEPPYPKLVNWPNVGKSNMSRQIGEVISIALTGLLCIFWTIPVSFVASLGNVEALTELLPFLQYPVENYPWFSNLLAQLAPLLLVVFIALLPYILLAFLKFECLIEIESMQHPSLFAKLAAFTIIQTFFISTIASTLFESLQAIAQNPALAIQLVAEALPAQAAYFIQIIMVQNLLALGIELLRISPVGQNFARKLVANLLGHNVTEKERNETFMGLRSLDNPLEYYFGRELGMKTILIQMVLYVYGCMSPITSYFTLLIFLLLAMGFRNQFIYVYPIANDSGGKLWINFTKISIVCMIVAEIILCAVLLLKQAIVAFALMIPLIIGTILFDIYFKRRHYATSRYLPTGDCAVADREHESEGMTFEWLKDAYLQPALKEKYKFPENYLEIDPEAKAWLEKMDEEPAEEDELAEEAEGDENAHDEDEHEDPPANNGCSIS